MKFEKSGSNYKIFEFNFDEISRSVVDINMVKILKLLYVCTSQFYGNSFYIDRLWFALIDVLLNA